MDVAKGHTWLLNELAQKLAKGKIKEVQALVRWAIDEGIGAQDILDHGLLKGMKTVSESYQSNRVFIPEILAAARAMNIAMRILKSKLITEPAQTAGRVCIGTVQGDLHDIGKNLVKMMMEAKGLEVIDLGTDVAPETFIQTAISEHCKVIAVCAMLTTTMNVMRDVVKAADKAGIREKIKIIIGGAPVTDAYCQQIGADAYTADAAAAAEQAIICCRSLEHGT